MILFKKICLAFLLTTLSQAAPYVLVTIKPIHSLVCGVMKDVGTPTLLMDGFKSPHTYSLRPGEAHQLETASIIIWVGPAYETTLKTRMAILTDRKKVLTLMDVDGLTLYQHRQGTLWGEDDHHHSTDSTHHHDYELDGHIWLAPNNAKAIVAAITKHLSTVDPENAVAYQRNCETLMRRLDDLAQELVSVLSPVKGKSYILYHDAMQYFDRYFGTASIGALVLEPDLPPSPRHTADLLEALKSGDATCLFMEPQFDAKLLKNLAKDANVPVNQLDYLGSDLDEGEQSYFDMMRRLANSLLMGLSGQELSTASNSVCLNCSKS